MGSSCDDTKAFQGRAYSGRPVGARHHRSDPDGRWRERKLALDRWAFQFRSVKRRRRPAPVGSGAQPGTLCHWYVLGHQRVRKVDQDTDATYLEGVKWKIGHGRPHWRRCPSNTTWASSSPTTLSRTEPGAKGEAPPPPCPARMKAFAVLLALASLSLVPVVAAEPDPPSEGEPCVGSWRTVAVCTSGGAGDCGGYWLSGRWHDFC